VTFLKGTDLYANTNYRAAIDAADSKYNGSVSAKAGKVKPSLEAIKARATAKDTVAE
jgi:hypothetical protein